MGDYFCKLRISITKAIDILNDKCAAAIFRAILHYWQDMEDIEIPQEALPVWEMIKADLQKDKEDKANGKKGGRPRTDESYIKPDTDNYDISIMQQAIRQGFSSADAMEIGKLYNTLQYRQYVPDALEACLSAQKTYIGYFKGIIKNKYEAR